MSVFEIIGGVIMILMGISIVLLVLMQEGTKDGVSALSGGSDSYLGKNQGRTKDVMFHKATRFCGIVFFVITIVVYALDKLL